MSEDKEDLYSIVSEMSADGRKPADIVHYLGEGRGIGLRSIVETLHDPKGCGMDAVGIVKAVKSNYLRVKDTQSLSRLLLDCHICEDANELACALKEGFNGEPEAVCSGLLRVFPASTVAIKFEWDSEWKSLVISGAGECMMDEIRANVVTKGAINLVANKIEGRSESEEESRQTIDEVIGDAYSSGQSIQSIRLVSGCYLNPGHYMASHATAGGDREQYIVTVHGNAIADGYAQQDIKEVLKKAISWDNGEQDINVVHGTTSRNHQSTQNIGQIYGEEECMRLM